MYYENAPAEADPYDLKAGLGSKHRSHLFAAGNQFMPEALGTSGAAEQVRRVEEWLHGQRVVPEIAKTWPQGPVVALKIDGPQAARPGETVRLQVVLSNNKAGHGFPTGPLNVGRAWIEMRIQDGTGREVFHSGALDAQNHVEAGTVVLRPLAIDAGGHMVMEPELWHPEGPIFRPAILPGKSDTYDYQFDVPRNATGALRVEARLRYRKANQFFLDSVYPPGSRRASVTDVSAGRAVIALQRTNPS
jgi:hypothetical protein